MRRGEAGVRSLGQETSPCALVGVALRRGMTGAAVGGACTAIMTAKDTIFFLHCLKSRSVQTFQTLGILGPRDATALFFIVSRSYINLSQKIVPQEIHR